ncbi:MAG: hypothetical protein ACXVHK_32525, partial [Solirubrobacteraceae bacterium]
FGIIGTLIAQLRPRAGWMAPTVTALLALAMLASYTHVLRRHISIWDSAFVAETSAMQELRQQMPRLPHGTTVFTSSYPANQTLGVPIFGDNWGLNGLIKIEYDDGTLSAYPMLAGMRIGCRAGGVRLEGEGALEFTAPYGRARLLDLQTGGHSIPRSRGQCKRAAHRYVPGPLYLSDAY